ncbi:hypothetical protein M413DRAFT_276296 [Hebeloma cylindrosporum]|uniref:Uncharacterized protein n=1 Tax=Hebeloma cylindrosporum TaxID=76867 RepID=A0A0C3BKM4_HEBCY|nr:hypothetical protein M413DRAFT_276296 [Hebeloma cylindrosporum h7]
MDSRLLSTRPTSRCTAFCSTHGMNRCSMNVIASGEKPHDNLSTFLVCSPIHRSSIRGERYFRA